MKHRRLVAGLVGACALALVAGPASAHNWNGNPSAPPSVLDETLPPGPDGSHTVNMTLGAANSPTNSISKSRPAGCDSNGGAAAGPVCSVEHIRLNLTAPAFNGTPNHQMAVLMCNSKLAAPTIDGGGDDPTGACDAGNARGLETALGVPGSGTFFLDGSGNLPASADTGQCAADPGLGCGDPGVQLNVTSCVTNADPGPQNGQPFDGGLASLGNVSCGNPNQNATCPPNPSHIATGWPCIVAVAEFVGVAAGTHVGFRTVQLKPPIPVSSEAVPNTIVSVPPTCNGGPCPVGASGSFGPIAPGVDVKVTGRRFPCKVVQPDDPSLNGGQNACLVAHTAKTVLVKRITTQLLEPSATVLTQTAGVDGSYTITFDMPNVVGSGFADSYRMVPHAPTCTFSQGPSATDPNYPNTCESQNHNASGIRLFQT